jgi:hypothetical protein
VTAIQAARAAAMLKDEGIDVTLESGPYGSFKVRVDDDVVVNGGALAFLGVLPTLNEIRSQVKEHRSGDTGKGEEE